MTRPPPVVCAWCPDFDPTAQAPGRSHGLCPTCAAKLAAALDARAAAKPQAA